MTPFSKASYLTKRLNVAGQRVLLSIWDTAGQERFHALGPIYYRDSNGAILVYDVTDEESFQKVSWFIYVKHCHVPYVCRNIFHVSLRFYDLNSTAFHIEMTATF